MNYTIINNDSLLALEELEENSIDSIVTDPPYELNFMNKGWDNAGISFNKEIWQKCLRVLKPGGYLLAFGGSRTFHRIAVAIEDAGFEIRDTIMWLYGSGFPKSMNIGLAIDKKNGVESEVIGQQVVPDITGDAYGTMNDKQGGSYKNIIRDIKKATNEWNGWGSALKPSFEPIIVARKPFKGSLVDNVIQNGVGGINIDECRVETQDDLYRKPCKNGSIYSQQEKKYSTGTMNDNYKLGRFPANTILTYDNINIDNKSWLRYFYCAKASKKDRDEGLNEFEEKPGGGMNGTLHQSLLTGSGNERSNLRKNIHPTVKPTELMQYLVRLVTPKGGTILDPFMGSGSTGKAVMFENKERNADYSFIGIEREKEYCDIAEARINYVIRQGEINERIIQKQ